MTPLLGSGRVVPILTSNTLTVQPRVTHLVPAKMASNFVPAKMASKSTAQSSTTLLAPPKLTTPLPPSVVDKMSKGNSSASRQSTLAPKRIEVQAKKPGKTGNGIFGDTTTKPLMSLDAMMLIEKFVREGIFPSLSKNEPIDEATVIRIYDHFKEALVILEKDKDRKKAEANRLEKERRLQEEERARQQDLQNRNKVCSKIPKLIQAYIDSIRKEIKELNRPITAAEQWKKEHIETYKEVCATDLAVVYQTPPQWVEHPYLDLAKMLSNSFVEQSMRVISMIEREERVDLEDRLSMRSGSKRPHGFHSTVDFKLFREKLQRNIKIVGRRAFRFLKCASESQLQRYSIELEQALIPRLDFSDQDQNKKTRVIVCLISNILGYIFSMAEEEEEVVNPMRNESISRILYDKELNEQRKIIFNKGRSLD